jgi:hypothetical protein
MRDASRSPAAAHRLIGDGVFHSYCSVEDDCRSLSDSSTERAMAKRFASPLYNVTTNGGDKLTIDVTNSISAGLTANAGLIRHVSQWMRKTGATRVLDFGAGALRHTIPLLERGYEVTAVEYARAYQRPKAAEFRTEAEGYHTFTKLMWPHDFLGCKLKYDVALLAYVLQVVPVKADRDAMLKCIATHLDKNGPKRVYYASRIGDARQLEPEMRYNDGWVRGRGSNDRSFYTEWTAADTDAFFLRAGFVRAGTYTGATQPFIYELPGML